MGNLIFKKTVDQSLLNAGMTIPIESHEKILEELGIALEKGDKQNIIVKIADQEYEVVITSANYSEKYVGRTVLQIGIYDPKHESFVKPATKLIILVDSVINTRKTMLGILEPSFYMACCVIQESVVSMFADRLFTVRVSKNFYVGEGVRTGGEGGSGYDYAVVQLAVRGI